MTDLILASASQSRRRMLAAAGVAFETVAPSVDEASVKEKLLARRAKPAEIAPALAELKALSVSEQARERFVLGADQVLVCGDRLYSKAAGEEEAKAILRALRGRKHELVTAAVLAKNGAAIWRHVETSQLWMREFSDAFLESYLAMEGEEVLGSVGCYRIEGLGARLFERIEGDNFAIQGLPLLAVLQALRNHGVVAG